MTKISNQPSSGDEEKTVSCGESAPTQLAKELDESKKFKWSDIRSGARADRYKDALEWLVSAGIVNKCTQVTDGVSPLKTFENPASFKLYLADTGLLSSLYDALPTDLDGTDHRSAMVFADKYQAKRIIRLSQKNFGTDGLIESIPLYAASLLGNHLKSR